MKPYTAFKCPCGHPACKSWMIDPAAAVQGVRFTQRQAEAVAQLLNLHPEWETAEDHETAYKIDGQRIKMSAVERALFIALFNARGAVVSKADLRANVTPGVGEYVRRLRAILAPTQFRVWNERGQGYRLARKDRI